MALAFPAALCIPGGEGVGSFSFAIAQVGCIETISLCWLQDETYWPWGTNAP